jgi:hypothetical protein
MNAQQISDFGLQILAALFAGGVPVAVYATALRRRLLGFAARGKCRAALVTRGGFEDEATGFGRDLKRDGIPNTFVTGTPLAAGGTDAIVLYRPATDTANELVRQAKEVAPGARVLLYTLEHVQLDADLRGGVLLSQSVERLWMDFQAVATRAGLSK